MNEYSVATDPLRTSCKGINREGNWLGKKRGCQTIGVNGMNFKDSKIQNHIPTPEYKLDVDEKRLTTPE